MAFVPGVPQLLADGGGAGGMSACVVVLVETAAELVVFLLGLVAVAAGVPGFLALGTVLPGLDALAAQAGQYHRDAEDQDRAGDGADDEELGSIVDAQRLAEQGRGCVSCSGFSGTRPMMIMSTPW